MPRPTFPKTQTFMGWVSLMVFSAVSLGAFVDLQRTKDDFNWNWNGVSSRDRWVLSCLAVSIIIPFIMCICHVCGVAKPMFDRFIGSFMVLWWCAGIATIMNTSNGYAMFLESEVPTIKSANLYFFSWGSFLSAIAVAGEGAKGMLDSSVQNEPKLVKWYLLLAASIVVLASSADIFIAGECMGSGSALCTRTKYALSLGCVAGFFSFGAIGLSSLGKMVKNLELGIALLVFFMYCAGVALITGSSGPGQGMGNLYFASWIGFVISLFLSASCMQDLISPKEEQQEQASPEKDDKDAEAPPEAAPEGQA